MTALDPRLKQWRWRVFAATWFSYFGFYFCRKPFYVIKPALEEHLGWDASMLGQLGAAYLIAYAIGQFVNGFAGNRFGPRILLLVGMATSLGCNLAFGLVDNFELFVAFMFVNGLAQATGWPGNVGTMATWFHRRERGTVMGIWGTCYQVGGIAAKGLAAFVLGLLISEGLNFQYTFFAGSSVMVFVWIFFLFNQRNEPEDLGLPPVDDPEEDEAPAAGTKPSGWTRDVAITVVMVGCFYFFLKFIRYALWSWAPYLLNKNYGMDIDEAGYMSTVFDIAGIAGVFITGWLSDKVFRGRRAKISFISVILMAASCGVLYTLGSSSLLVFAVSLGFIGFTLYGPDALMSGAAAMDVGSKRDATLAAGVINGLGSCGSVVQEFYLGALLESGSADAAFGALLAASLGAILFLSLVLIRNATGKSDL